MSKFLRLILIIPAVLGPIALARGVWALQQPWGVTSQKALALIFFFIMWITSLFMLFRHKFALEPNKAEQTNWLLHAIGSGTFVLGGIFLLVIRPDAWIKTALATGFFALCFLVAVRNIAKA